jgi:DNA-binding FadR family transcriptional regulator
MPALFAWLWIQHGQGAIPCVAHRSLRRRAQLQQRAWPVDSTSIQTTLVWFADQHGRFGSSQEEEMPSRATPWDPFAQTPHLKPEVGRRTVREQISDKLASLVASGILQVGEALPSERELANLLDVSRESVRGAIQKLAAMGVVAVSQGSRTRVVSGKIDTLKIGVASQSAINAYDLESVHKSRLLIERAVAAEAARHIDEDTLARLQHSLNVQKRTFRDPLHFLICDREFHIAIYRSCGNPLLADFVTNLYSFMLDQRKLAVSEPGAIEQSYREHVAIYRALKAREPESATEAFGRHIERIYVTTVDVLTDKPVVKRTA